MKIPYFPLLKTTYSKAQNVQTQLSRQILNAKLLSNPVQLNSMAFLAYEMSPVYTLGRRQQLDLTKSHFPNNAELIKTTRGGHTTFHGPGQLVLYPILDLQKLRIKIRDYINILETSIIRTLAKYEIEAEQRPQKGMNGVFIKNKNEKIASIGVHVQRNVTTHGLALNIDLDPKWFNQIVACDLPMTKMVSVSDYVKTAPHLTNVADLLVHEITNEMNLPYELKLPQDSINLINIYNI